MKDHRFTMGSLQNIPVTTGSFSSWNSYVLPEVNGSCLAHGGAATICPILTSAFQTTKSLDSGGTFSAGVWTNWQTNFAANGLGSAGNLPLFDQLVDEPSGTTAFTTLVSNASTRHGFTTPGVPEMVTTDIFFGQGNQTAANTFSNTVCGSNSCILNSIDIFTVLNTVLEPVGGPIEPASAYTSWLAGSTAGITRHRWGYQDCTSTGTCSDTLPGPAPSGNSYMTYANYSLDGKPAAHRAAEWLSFLHGQTGELYFAADECTPPTFAASCTQPTTASVSATVILTNGSANITWAGNTLVSGQIVMLATTGALPTNFASQTVYYVVSTGNPFQVSASFGGSAIVAGSAGSGTQTAYLSDPWQGIYFSGGWGDGTLVYPGCVVSTATCYMGSGVTTPIILPSIRLSDIRDGVQDYEYLNALTVAGKGSVVSTQIASWITNSYTFETSGAGLQAARLNLGTTMHQLSFPPTTGTTIQGVTLSNGAKIQ